MKKYNGRLAFWGKICAIVCAAAVIAGPLGSVAARGSSSMEDIQNKMQQIKEENEERRKKIDELGDDIDKNETDMGLVSEHIDGINSEITEYGRLILAKQDDIDGKKLDIARVEGTKEDKEKEIEQKKEKIALLQEENRMNLNKFAKLARVLYMNDSSGTLPILNGSDDWYNYFVYSDVVENISGQNLMFMQKLMATIEDQNRLIDDLNDAIAGLEADKKKLQNEKESLESDLEELETYRNDLADYAWQQKSYLSGLVSKNAELRSKVESLEYDIALSNEKLNELDIELQRLIREAQAANGERPAFTDGFRWPLDPQFHYITTYYGYDAWRGGNHGGIDVGNAGIGGQNIYAAQSGTIITVSNTCSHNWGKYYSCGCGGGFGNYIVIDHGGKLSTLYAHCSAIYVSVGEFVNKGDVIGAVGTTGWSTGNHLHFEVRVDGARTDPFGYSYADY